MLNYNWVKSSQMTHILCKEKKILFVIVIFPLYLGRLLVRWILCFKAFFFFSFLPLQEWWVPMSNIISHYQILDHQLIIAIIRHNGDFWFHRSNRYIERLLYFQSHWFHRRQFVLKISWSGWLLVPITSLHPIMIIFSTSRVLANLSCSSIHFVWSNAKLAQAHLDETFLPCDRLTLNAEEIASPRLYYIT